MCWGLTELRENEMVLFRVAGHRMSWRVTMTRCRLWVVLFALLTAANTALAAEFYVAPGGRDANPGTMTEPFGTLERARDVVRALKGSDCACD